MTTNSKLKSYCLAFADDNDEPTIFADLSFQDPWRKNNKPCAANLLASWRVLQEQIEDASKAKENTPNSVALQSFVDIATFAMLVIAVTVNDEYKDDPERDGTMLALGDKVAAAGALIMAIVASSDPMEQMKMFMETVEENYNKAMEDLDK